MFDLTHEKAKNVVKNLNPEQSELVAKHGMNPATVIGVLPYAASLKVEEMLKASKLAAP